MNRRRSPASVPLRCAPLPPRSGSSWSTKVTRTGGHLGPNLGVVELTIALHRAFDSPTDVLLFDTGHQAYVHKLLTGRRAGFDRLRQAGGLSRGRAARGGITARRRTLARCVSAHAIRRRCQSAFTRGDPFRLPSTTGWRRLKQASVRRWRRSWRSVRYAATTTRCPSRYTPWVARSTCLTRSNAPFTGSHRYASTAGARSWVTGSR